MPSLWDTLKGEPKLTKDGQVKGISLETQDGKKFADLDFGTGYNSQDADHLHLYNNEGKRDKEHYYGDWRRNVDEQGGPDDN